MHFGDAPDSTVVQKRDLQGDALSKAGGEPIFTASAGGAGAERVGLEQAPGLRLQGVHPRHLGGLDRPGMTFQLAEVAVPRELSRRSRLGSVGCACPEPRIDRSSRADESGVEPRRTGMVRHELRGHAGDRAVGGLPRCSIGQPARRTPRFLRLPLDRAFGPSPIRVEETSARSPTARPRPIWEIPANSKVPSREGELWKRHSGRDGRISSVVRTGR